MVEPLLSARQLNKSFGPVHVLHDVDFDVYPGEVTALVGDNGAGKSTLVKCFAGINSIDSGELIFEGKPVAIHDPRAATDLGIEFVYQDLALADNLDITQNMFLGRESRRLHTFLADGEMEKKARETLVSLSVRTVSSVRQLVANLSGGQRQTVAIAKAVLWNSKVVFLGRAHGGPRCGADAAGPRPGSSPGRPRPRRRADLTQHERRDGGR